VTGSPVRRLAPAFPAGDDPAMRSALALLPVLAAAPLAQPDPPIATRFFAQAKVDVPLAEYPRPQLQRERWLCLNGLWEFRRSTEGVYDQRIRVPFAPETAASGLYLQQEIVERCGYRRRFTIPADWKGQQVLLHFEAVDWEAKVRVDGKQVAEHRGGYDRFTARLTGELARPGEHVLEVDVFDPADPKKDGFQPRGKQLGSHSIWYTRTTGIWRSVWCEPVGETAIDELRIRAEADGSLEIEARLLGERKDLHLHAIVSGRGKDGAEVHQVLRGDLTLKGTVSGVRPWSPQDPALYDLELFVEDAGNQQLDAVKSYTGFCSVRIADGRWTLNGRPCFLRGVLDQGYWPESGMTAPSDEALRFDVQACKDLGFNLARKHVKIEDQRWYSWCDKLGLMVMQDMPSSMNLGSEAARANFTAELGEAIAQLQSHPSVVHWVVINEDWGRPGEFQTALVRKVRAWDRTRTVTDASGWTQRADARPDFTDIHDYGSNLARHGGALTSPQKLIGECGGVGFSLTGHRWSEGWGYTQATSADGFLRKVHRLAAQAHAAENLAGFVWTQLTDVEQELNGLLHYDRTEKVPVAALAQILRGEKPLPPLRTLPEFLVSPFFAAGTGIADASHKKENLDKLGAMLDRAFVEREAELSPERCGDWQRVATAGGAVDLQKHHGGPKDGVAYAVGVLESEKGGKVRLLFGSDDAACVWVNGKQVHRVVAVRGVGLDDEIEGVELQPGRNVVVVKVAQGVFGCGFVVAIE
jgi:hypothetical protein